MLCFPFLTQKKKKKTFVTIMSLSSSKFYYWLDNHTPFMSSNHTYELFFFRLVKHKYPLHFSESEVCSKAKISSLPPLGMSSQLKSCTIPHRPQTQLIILDYNINYKEHINIYIHRFANNWNHELKTLYPNIIS